MTTIDLVDDAGDDDATRKECIRLLKSSVPGLGDERANQLLDLCTPQEDVTSWAEAAIVQLAVDNEVQDETDDLERAMQESLEQAEAREATETPLEERNLEEILGGFPGSALSKLLFSLTTEDDTMKNGVEEDEKLKKLVVGLLRMEQRCKRWYPISFLYFEDFAEEVKASLNQSINLLTDLSHVLEAEIQSLEQAVFAYPTCTSRDRVPTIFAAKRQIDDDPIINLLDPE